jgi:hypothetical protein
MLEAHLGNIPILERKWKLPIELLWRLRLDYGDLTDFIINFELDLLSQWGNSVAWGTGSYAGVLVQNETSDVPGMLLDTYGGGEIPWPNTWAGQLNEEYSNALPDPDGRYFFVRHLIESNGSWAKTWFDGDPEPSDYQVHQFDTVGDRIFVAGDAFTFYVYTEMSKQPVAALVDSLTVVKGFGKPALLVDDFKRTVGVDPIRVVDDPQHVEFGSFTSSTTNGPNNAPQVGDLMVYMVAGQVNIKTSTPLIAPAGFTAYYRVSDPGSGASTGNFFTGILYKIADAFDAAGAGTYTFSAATGASFIGTPRSVFYTFRGVIDQGSPATGAYSAAPVGVLSTPRQFSTDPIAVLAVKAWIAISGTYSGSQLGVNTSTFLDQDGYLCDRDSSPGGTGNGFSAVFGFKLNPTSTEQLTADPTGPDVPLLIKGWFFQPSEGACGNEWGAGWGTSKVGLPWQVEAGQSDTQYRVDGENGRWERECPENDTSGIITLTLPNGIY